MSAVGTAIRLAERNGISIPEFIKFLASPAGYAISKALDAIETQTNLPQGILSLAQNPAGAATNYLQTQAENALFNENNTSKIENIISELQGTNPDKPNYVGPQQPDSPLSQLNTSMLPFDLGVQPSDESVRASSNNMNDELREGMFGTQTENFPNFVGPLSENSPAFLSDLSFLPADLGVQPTSTAAVTSNTPVISNTPVTSNSVTSNTSNNSELPALTSDFLQQIMSPPTEVNPNRDFVREIQGNNSPIFGTSTPESLGFTEVQSMPDYSRAYSALGGAEVVNNLRNQFLDMGLDENTISSVFSPYYAPEIGGGKLEDFSYSQYRHGGQIYGGRR